MKRTFWLFTAIVAAAFFLAACGSVLDGAGQAPNADLTTLVEPSDTVISSDPALLTPAYWRDWGGFAECWVDVTGWSDADYVLSYSIPGFMWTLGVVTQLGDPDHTHLLFADPVEGDVFATGGYDQVILCKNEEPRDGGCTLTQGYWKTHSSSGPAARDDTWDALGEDTEFYLSGMSYIDVFWTSPRGNGYFILAHQFIAAKLNEARGADVSAVATELAAAEAWFGTYGPGDLDRDQNAAAKALAETLDLYNNGEIGPGHCE